MASLPFLVEHGAIVWQGLAALAAVSAVGAVRRARARWERRATARDLAAYAAQTTAPVEGRATIRGTLRGGRAASVSLLHLRGPRPYYDERAPQLWLDCDGERVALDGAIRVVRGTRVVSTRDRRSAIPDDELAVRSSPVLHRLPAMAVSVRDGDDVFVTAHLASRPGAEVRGYREATTAWMASADGGEIALIAAEPEIRAIPLGRTRSAALGLAAAALAIGGLWTAGSAALWWTHRTATDTGYLVRAQLAELEPVVLAAATPGHRDVALAALEARFAARFQRTPEALAQWRRVAHLRRGCGGEIEAQIAQGEIDGLAELAQHCDDDRAAGDAYQLLGRFRDAVERDAELPVAEQHVESLIAIGAWQRASWWAGTQLGGDGQLPRAFQCAEQWFHWLAGTNPASETQARLPRGDPACAVIAALVLPETRRAGALASAATHAEVETMADALAWAEGAPRRVDRIIPTGRVALHRAMFDPDDRTTIARALLSGPALDHAGSTPGRRDTIAWRAVLAMLSGDLDGARIRARTFTSEPPGPDIVDYRPLPPGSYNHALDVAFALRAAQPLPALKIERRAWRADPPGAITDPDLLWQRYEAMYWGALAGRRVCDRPDLGPGSDFKAVVLRAARSRDGHELADRLAQCRLGDAAAIEAVFAVWPRLRTGVGPLADVLRTIDLGPPATEPLAVIGQAAMRRDLARLTGDPARAAAWQAVVERHLAAFSGDTDLTALMVRELLRAAASSR
ncbi:MAG TPA: hypothetical protein VHW23_07065 [Kofleriaceae bacterium]|jgi:hypothetical protein|nr:hypothetical protein [Kofleriaceae bacterium]